MSRRFVRSAAAGEKPGLVGDLTAGALMLGFAGLYGWAASVIPKSRLDDTVGAAGLPLALSGVLAALAVILIVRSAGRILVARAEKARSDAPRSDRSGPCWSRHVRALGMLAFGVGYVLLLPVIGYAASIACLLLVVAIYSGARPGFRTVLFAVTASGLAYAVFVVALGIPLPAGVLMPD